MASNLNSFTGVEPNQALLVPAVPAIVLNRGIVVSQVVRIIVGVLAVTHPA